VTATVTATGKRCRACGRPISGRSHSAKYCLGCVSIPRPQCQACSGDGEGEAVCERHLKEELGLTYRQLDYWVRAGHLHPERPFEGSGIRRHWPESDLAAARLIGRLTSAGLSLEVAARVARSGQSRCEIASGVWIEVTA
jgi:hypothetical protein